MKRLVILSLVLTFLILDLAWSANDQESFPENPLDNPWKAWKHPEIYEGHDVIRRRSARSVYSRGGMTSSERDAGYGTHQRRHHRAENRRNRDRVKDDLYDEKALASMAKLGGLDESGQWPENCTYCAMRQASKEYRLEQIRREILAKLRLESPPNITDKRLPQYPEITEWLSKFPETPADEDTVEPMVKIISMINIAHPPPPEKTLPDMANVCYFEFQSDVEPTDIVSAKLGVFVRKVSVPTHTITMFLIYKVKPRRRGNILIKRKRVRLNEEDTNKWHRFDVDAVVKNWVRNPANNYGLQIMIFDDYGQSLAIVTPENEEEELYKPYIEVEIREKSSSRERRMTGLDCDEEGAETRCCRYPLLVDFESYGWDWIIQPKRYHAYYCSGECNFAFLVSTAYGHLLQQTSKGNGPCCTPRKMSPISMLYFDQDYNIVYGTLPGMVVDRCGCS